MSRLPRLRSFLSALLRRRRVEADMEEEWRAHLDAHADALVAAGMSQADARRRARRDFGDPLRWKEQARDVRGVGWVNGLGADIRYGLRQMRRAPVFTTTVLMTLADLKFSPGFINELVGLTESGLISSKIAQDVFNEMFSTGESPAAIVERKGLAQVSDTGAIEKFCDEVIAANPGPAGDFKAGKEAALNFLKGQVMKASKGKANPGLVGEILTRKLRG